MTSLKRQDQLVIRSVIIEKILFLFILSSLCHAMLKKKKKSPKLIAIFFWLTEGLLVVTKHDKKHDWWSFVKGWKIVLFKKKAFSP